MTSLVRPWSLTEPGTPLENAHRALDRIEAVDGRVRAFVAEPDRRERLLAEAEAAPEGPLRGVPVGIKDIVNAEGLPTRGGSGLPPEVVGGPEATVVTRLRAAGALVAGKTVTAEFAVLAPGETVNPHDPAHTPGGSSSGSAAGVAAGMVPLAIGTQTVGSVIRPSAFCGITGFKPTHGRIPIDGVIPNAPTYDTLGLHAADLAGIAAAAPVLLDGWRDTADARPPVLGVPDGPYLAHADIGAIASLEEQIERLREAGYAIVRARPFDDFEHIRAVQFTVNRFELARSHADWYAKYGELYRPQTARAIGEGHPITEGAYAEALAEREDVRARLAAHTDAAGVDVWLAPPATGVAPEGLGNTGNAVMCLPWSFTGWPSLTLPVPRPAGALPLGLQLAARPGADEELLSWAAGVEGVIR
ncbi:amidase [Actinorhabdospora filicis]|nr:amidase [Actinorhabdospora filicis]